MGYLAVQQHLPTFTKHLAGLQLARHKARHLSHLHTFNPKFKNTFEWEIMKNCWKSVFQAVKNSGKRHPVQGLAPLETADLASSNLKIWLPHFCFLLFYSLLIGTLQWATEGTVCCSDSIENLFKVILKSSLKYPLSIYCLIFFVTTTTIPVSYTHLTLPTKRIV